MVRSHRPLLIATAIAAPVVIAGVALIIAGLASPVTFGWFAYQPLADQVFVPSGGLFVSPLTIAGAGMLTLGLIAIAFFAGWRVGSTRAVS